MLGWSRAAARFGASVGGGRSTWLRYPGVVERRRFAASGEPPAGAPAAGAPEESPPVATDSIDFGKYRGQTFGAVAKSDPQYCEWVMRQSSKPDCGPKLLSFARWLELQGVATGGVAPTPASAVPLRK